MYKPIIIGSSNKYGNNRWKSYSIKLQREIFLTSDLEYYHWLHVEFDPNIVSYCEQPFEIKIPYKNIIASSIPDMWKLHSNGQEEIVEVKYSTDLCSPRVLKQLEVQRKWCTINGVTHNVITENEVNQSAILLSNYKMILKILKQTTQIDTSLKDNVIEVVKDSKCFKLSELSKILDVPLNDLNNNILFTI